ncbi:hypothetical protein J6590_077183 [Homalodisca vitripennis]|nr:hypothetical protein J6590_077183 [Homalodisca vitripennis]
MADKGRVTVFLLVKCVSPCGELNMPRTPIDFRTTTNGWAACMDKIALRSPIEAAATLNVALSGYLAITVLIGNQLFDYS